MADISSLIDQPHTPNTENVAPNMMDNFQQQQQQQQTPVKDDDEEDPDNDVSMLDSSNDKQGKKATAESSVSYSF